MPWSIYRCSMSLAGQRTVSWITVGLAGLGRRRVKLNPVQPSRPRGYTRRIVKCMCISAVTLPVGFHLASHLSIKPLLAQATPTMTHPPPPVSEIVSRADELYDSNKMREGLTYLKQYEHFDEVEVLWRLARFCYKTGMYQSQDKEEGKKLAEQGWSYVERALSLGGDKHNSCQRWAGILLSWSSEHEGYKKKIEKSFEIRDHFLKAIECDSGDSTSMHLLGQWCYSVVSVPWYQRKVATVLFATPPQSTYEEALSHFENAEKATPGFYMVNWLWLGKCHLAMGHKEKAKPWLEKVVGYDTHLEEELEAKKEAEGLLGQL